MGVVTPTYNHNTWVEKEGLDVWGYQESISKD